MKIIILSYGNCIISAYLIEHSIFRQSTDSFNNMFSFYPISAVHFIYVVIL